MGIGYKEFYIHYIIYFVFAKRVLSRWPGGGKSREKSRKNTEKLLDLASRLCYTSFYLSDERFLFARFFGRRRPSIPHTGRQCPRLFCG